MDLCLKQNQLVLFFANKRIHCIQSKHKRDLLKKNIRNLQVGLEALKSMLQHTSCLLLTLLGRWGRHSNPYCRCWDGTLEPLRLLHSKTDGSSANFKSIDSLWSLLPVFFCFLFKDCVSCRCIWLWNLSHLPIRWNVEAGWSQLWEVMVKFQGCYRLVYKLLVIWSGP